MKLPEPNPALPIDFQIALLRMQQALIMQRACLDVEILETIITVYAKLESKTQASGEGKC